MNIMIEGNINVDGQWWGVSIERLIADGSPEEKVEQLKKVIRGLKKAGIISRVTAPSFEGQSAGVATPHQSPAPNGTTSPAFTLPPPHCDVHRAEMKVSNIQKTPGMVQYFCTKEFGNGYCNKRASVDEKTGMPKFWEVA